MKKKGKKERLEFDINFNIKKNGFWYFHFSITRTRTSLEIICWIWDRCIICTGF